MNEKEHDIILFNVGDYVILARQFVPTKANCDVTGRIVKIRKYYFSSTHLAIKFLVKLDISLDESLNDDGIIEFYEWQMILDVARNRSEKLQKLLIQ
jgi:hypothetical protein